MKKLEQVQSLAAQLKLAKEKSAAHEKEASESIA